MTVYVISNNGEKLMPTTRLGRIRRLLKDGQATIVNRHPFTVQLLYDSTAYTQPLELCVDTGYQHIGLSVKSEAREYDSVQYDLLDNEKQHHDDARKYRRIRRNRLRYRAPRFDNRVRGKQKGWLAPSLKNKAERHIAIITSYTKVAPVQRIVLEMGQFDTQVLQAVQEGKPIPQGIDYQQGECYGVATLREAVFQRDGYKCRICGRSIKDGAILHAHHVYFWRGQHGNRLSELATCCEKCHTPKNHKPGGKLYGYDKKLPAYQGAAFMNTVKWYIYNAVKAISPMEVSITYGAATKLARHSLGLDKSHCNDAYSMGTFHPAVRAKPALYVKRRRNNRVLEKFYDAKYVDVRTGEKASGMQLGCQRTNRREPRNADKNLRIYHGAQISKGRRSIRRQRYPIQPHDVLLFHGKRYMAKGIQNLGVYVAVDGRTPIPSAKCTILSHSSGWVRCS
jgi:hypothetical protein